MRLVIAIALLSVACDFASRQKKLPELPRPPALDTRPRDPAAWTAAGDAACPAIDTGQSLPGGPPGSTLREGRITRDPQTGRLACQVIGRDHGPATEPDGSGGTATGTYAMGKRTGPWIGRYAGGRVAWKGSYLDGVETGQWTYWSPGGALLATGDVSGTRRTGMWALWSERADPGDPPERFELHEKKNLYRGVVLDGEPVITHSVCGLGMAAPRCQMILASGIGFRVGPENDSPVDESRWSAVLDADLIANIASRHGVGLGGGIYLDDEYARTGLRISYRYWIDYWLAGEVAGGLLFPRSGLESPGDRGESVRLALSFADQGSLGIEIQRFDDDGAGPELAAHLTLKIGVVPLAIAAVTALRIGAAVK